MLTSESGPWLPSTSQLGSELDLEVTVQLSADLSPEPALQRQMAIELACEPELVSELAI